MAIYKTAQGRMLDMAALAAKNERTRAVGNMKVNARGDIIDRNGNIVTPVNEKINDQYAKTVGNKSAVPVGRNGEVVVTKSRPPEQKTPPRTELTDAERELEDSLNDDLEIEQIKSKEVKKRK